ncbi:MAG: magnesium/cobalt transporter CorA [Pirellulales bacterium]|nr:magnesium/cobalt transporter CorA [Pirellulales bacterium]
MFKKKHPEVGARPGTLVIEDGAPPPKIRIMSFNRQQVEEQDVSDLETLREAHSEQTVTWIDVQGFGDEAAIRKIGEIFSLHPLTMENIINVPQRPKAESYDDQLLLIARMVTFDESAGINVEQVSIVFGKNYVITFQERYGDVFDPIRERIRNPKGRMRQHGPSYLAYALFDTIIDAYYPVLENIGNYLEQLEDVVVRHPSPAVLLHLNQIKNRLVNLRRSMWPQREAVNSLISDSHPLIENEVLVYLRATYDHCIQTLEVMEMYREMVSGLMNTYQSAVSNRTNEVMKVLTIVATIFIPLTFLAGIYGMNFDNMPELHIWWAYPITWLIMIITAAGMILFFRRRGWIGNFKFDKRELMDELLEEQ